MFHQDSSTVDLWLMPMEGDRKAFPFLNTSANEMFGRFSPDSKYLAYTSDELGQFKIFVQPVPANGSKWQVSKGGGGSPEWSQDGAELYFQAPDGKVMAVLVKTSPVFESGTPQALFDAAIPTLAGYGSYTAAAVLVMVPPTGAAGEAPPLTVSTHWQAGLKKSRWRVQLGGNSLADSINCSCSNVEPNSPGSLDRDPLFSDPRCHLLLYRLLKNVFTIGLQSWLSIPLGIVLLIAGTPTALWSRKSRILIFVALGAAFPLFLMPFHTPQYASLLIVTLFLIAILGFRRLYLFQVGAFTAGKSAASSLPTTWAQPVSRP